ncbi:helix-turn-helix domain-containing protein [Hymenobacter sp. 5317J-9]|uniref:helix-turn-helix domain-containing protein n=1 Tax=Hymenobacter sp. 5317J-9 TaxID=2932250 RepID=UPI001FD64E1B|nr:helix-turn-helix domain-containing protein [Hymenobacter sp. 5317J-9]UOQ96648.1 helix-turn-helix domain-containing protein [Hymenobacter sp. 5317J-9]
MFDTIRRALALLRERCRDVTQTYVINLQLTAFYCKFSTKKDFKVQQHPINERISFLLKSLKLSARAFSEMIGEKPTITQNYVGSRNSMPGADYLEKVLKHFESINPAWLLTGEGEPFLPGTQPTQNISTTKGKGNIIGQAIGTAIGNINLDDCKRELASSQKELEHLRQQLELKDALLAAKDEMLTLLRGSHNRPN